MAQPILIQDNQAHYNWVCNPINHVYLPWDLPPEFWYPDPNRAVFDWWGNPIDWINVDLIYNNMVIDQDNNAAL